MNYTGPLGTLEQILQSLLVDLSAISVANGYSTNVYKVTRQYEGSADMGGPTIQILSATKTKSLNILSDIVKRATVITIVASINDSTINSDGTRNIVTLTEAFARDIKKALHANPYRSLTINGTPTRLAWYSTVIEEGTGYKPPLGTAALFLWVSYIDTL